MSDKLRQDFDLYYKELENFTGHYKTSSQAVETDKKLSRVGKHEKIADLKEEHFKNVDSLAERFQGEFSERVSNIGRHVRGEKKDAVLDSIKRRFSKGESLSSDESSRLLLSEMRENKVLIHKSNFQGMLYTATAEQLKKTAQSLSDSQDVRKLEWLQEIASLKGEQVLSSTIQAQVNAVRDSTLSDEQKTLKGVSEKIEREMKLFDYSIQRAKKGDFVDVRNNDNTEVQ